MKKHNERAELIRKALETMRKTRHSIAFHAHLTSEEKHSLSAPILDAEIDLRLCAAMLEAQPAEQASEPKAIYQIRIEGSNEWRDCDKETFYYYTLIKSETRILYAAPPAQPAREWDAPTQEMIDAAEAVDWSDSNVRGSIVNMWNAMVAKLREKNAGLPAAVPDDIPAILKKQAS